MQSYEYPPALWDDSDPLYAPGRNLSADGRLSWRPTRAALRKGWPIKYRALSGTDEEIAGKCRALTRDMVRFTQEADRLIEPNTWAWLFARYLSDEFSPFREVKANTAYQYRWSIDRWREAIGDDPMTNCSFTTLKGWQRTMEKNGRSVDYIARQFRILRLVVRFGVLLEDADSIRIAGILSAMRIESPAPRSVYPTRAQIASVIAKADEAGEHAFALLLMMQFELAIRAVDLRGQWLPAAGEGGIVARGVRWQDGLTWDMLAPDLSAFTKVISKTARKKPEPSTFDLSSLPEVRRRLAEIAPTLRVGPVFLGHTGLPMRKEDASRMWRKFAKAAGLPAEIQMRDSRSGALTEASSMGASPFAVRDLARHSDVTTTNRYVRGADQASAQVVALRQSGTKTKPADR